MKHQPQIKYEVNIGSPLNNKKDHKNKIGKQSMQEEIRKIVEALNEGGKSNRTESVLTNRSMKREANQKNLSQLNTSRSFYEKSQSKNNNRKKNMNQ